MAAAAAAAMMRPVAPPPGGARAVQSARPITRNGPAPDPSVWQGYIAEQVCVLACVFVCVKLVCCLFCLFQYT